jgi:hypothetical protein
MMGLTAVTLEPENVSYRVNVANVLLEMKQANAAVEVLRAAAKVAKTPQEEMEVENLLMNAQEYAASQQEAKNRVTADAKVDAQVTSTTVITSDVSVPRLSHVDRFIAKGPHKFVTGVLKNVHCDTPIIDLTVDSSGKLIALHSENYYKVEYSTLNFKPSGELKPCQDLEGRPAKVEYVESMNASDTPRVLAVELHK